MFKNKRKDGKLNICGAKVADLRKSINPKLSQRGFAVMLQNSGLDVDKNAIQRIEAGKRFVTDIELKILAQVLNCSIDYLIEAKK